MLPGISWMQNQRESLQSHVSRFLATLLILFVSVFVRAESRNLFPPFKSRLWQVSDDASRNTVRSVTQTPDGFLWIGTQGGLARFDGEKFEFVTLAPEGNRRTQQINVVSTDTAGNLWVGTAQGLFESKGSKWATFKMPVEVDDTILSINGDHAENIWIGTRLGLVRIRGSEVSLVGKISSPSILERNTAIHSIRSMAGTVNGDLWVSASDSVILLKNGVAVTNQSFDVFRPEFIRATCCRRDGSIWVGSNAGLLRFKDGKYTQFTKTNGLPDNTVTAVYEDRRGILWIGTYGGLARFVNEKIVVETRTEAEPRDQILCFFEDQENNLWVGAKDGLYQLNAQQFTTLSTQNGLAHNNVTSVFEDREGAIWIGTWGGGLHRWHDDKMTVFSTANTPGLRNDLVLAIYGARDGSLWFGEDYLGGIYHWKNGKPERFGREQNVMRSAVRALLEDNNGRMLFGHASSGLGVLENGRASYLDTRQGLAGQDVRCLLRAQDGTIWVGTDGGLSSWRDNKFRTYRKTNGLCDNTILSLYEDKDQELWIGTAKGLSRKKHNLDQGSSQPDFVSYSGQNGFVDESIVEIIEDDGNLWLASAGGVLRAKKKDFDGFDAGTSKKISYTLFGKADGMFSQVCVGVAKPSAIQTRDGRLLFATTKGLAMTDPKLRIGKNEKAPPVVIREILADKRPVEGNGLQVGPRITSSPQPQPLNIKPGRGELEFHYAALSYCSPEKNRFKYKLEGFDSDWTDAETRHAAFYNSVPPGNYTFHVIACNNDGLWNEKGMSIVFILQPHFWQTLTFKMFLFAAGIVVVAAWARSITRRRMLLRVQRLEQQNAIEKERARIAEDMHDDLGAGLTGVLLLTEKVQNSSTKEEAANNGREIAESVRDLAQNLDALVWAENPRHDNSARLISYVTEYAVKFLGKASIRCRLDLPDELPEFPASSEMRHNVYLVVKEALNNIAKYAQATEVWIRLKVDGTRLSLAIEDNGKGFSNDQTSVFGNGLTNMRKRIEEVGGRFCIASEPGKGTRIEIQISVKSANAER
ncbi:MAG: putative two-component system sensor kinase [Verrucomicrobiales bacterium]|nr:putative two-component system sensor kinase [Verrucomicrobiales bacterium]